MFYDEMENKQTEKRLLDSLSFEIDSFFLKLRKDYQIICRELKLLKKQSACNIQEACITPLDEEGLQKILKKLPLQLIDEYVMYMLCDESNNIFKLIDKYNQLVSQRQSKYENNIALDLTSIDEKLADCLQQLGAMIYHLHSHLHIHLNLLTLWLKNASIQGEIQQKVSRDSKEF